MRKIVLASMLSISACGGATTATTTTLDDVAPIAPVSTSTTVPGQALVVQDCETPPITFSALCEVYELIQEWHVDRPLDAARLAGVALRALTDYRGGETETPPRTLFCAIPDPSFSDFCEELAGMVGDHQLAIGPAVDAAVVAMADLGLDPFSYYVPPEQAESFRANGIVGGLGILLDATDAAGSRCARIGPECPLEVVFVIEDNPGAEAGLLPGDRITGIDGESVNGLGFTQTASLLASDETGLVEVTIERDSETIVFTIERDELVVPTVEVELPLEGVGYLRIPDFETDIPGLVEEALLALDEFRPGTIVVDLRDNPGGFVDVMVEVASQFVAEGLLFETFGPDERLGYEATGGGLATSQRLIVLVNRGTASAAEILAGTLRERRGALILGLPTFGKDAVQLPFELRNGGQLYVAVARWATPGGATVGNGGLSPDRELELGMELTTEEIVEAALDAAS